MKKLLMCAIAGAFVAQIWGTISWVALPWHNLDFKEFKDADAVAEVLGPQLQGSGLYTLPNMDLTVHEDAEKMAAWNAKARKGPFAFMSIRADGVEPGMAVPMSAGFVLNIFIAMLLTWMCSKTTIDGTLGRAIFIGIGGSVGALYPHISNMLWWHFPVSYCVIGVVDLFITWSLAGFVIAKLSNRLA